MTIGLDTCKKRREELINWVIKNWGIDKHYQEPIVDVIEEDDEPIFNDVD